MLEFASPAAARLITNVDHRRRCDIGSYCWRGKTTGDRYEFMQQAIPAALIDPFGQPLLEGNFNGELVVNCNHDNSVARAVATGPPPGATAMPTPGGVSGNDIYSAYTADSLWEQSP